MAEVVLENVSRVYPGGTLAVDSVNLRAADREFLVLVGPSGCGKSTTLRMIAGLEEVTSGEVRIGERRVNDIPPRDRDIAMVFQNYALYPHMTVARNMAFGLELRYGGWWPRRLARRLWHPVLAANLAQKRRGIEGQVRQVARSLAIEHLLQRMPRELSGGERQRVALGRAIVREPAAFLFDEPLSNLDARLRVETRRELKALHQRLQATMIYVTHDQVEALTLGDRIAVMDGGVLQQVGTPLEVYNRPKNLFVAGFLGTPAMNFLKGTLDTVQDRLVFRGSGVVQSLVGPQAAAIGDRNRRITLGIRPEHVQLTPEGSIAARVTLVEPMGDASLVYLDVCGAGGLDGNGIDSGAGKSQAALSSKVDASTVLYVGEEVRLKLDSPRIHLFDSDTGENLVAG